MHRLLACVVIPFGLAAFACSKSEPVKAAPPLPPVGPLNPPSGAPPAAAKPPQPKAAEPKPSVENKPKAEPLDPKKVVSPAGISFDVPEGWKRVEPATKMRVAEIVPPRAAGDADDATLVVTFFPGGAGALEANIDRWLGQMIDADGAPTPRERAHIEEVPIGSLKATVVDVESGTYKDTGPMASTTPKIASARLLAAQLEGPTGAYYFKLVGPAKTVTAARDAYFAMLRSAKVKE